jgi:outer membrane biosynthesis protein TonB
MDSPKKRKEITALIDNIKMHSDRLTDSQNVPILELSVILSKITRLHEKTVILKYLLAKEQNHEDEEFGIEDIYQEKQKLESELSQPTQSASDVNAPTPEAEKEEDAEGKSEELAKEKPEEQKEEETKSPDKATNEEKEQATVKEIKKEIIADLPKETEAVPKEMPDLNEQYAGDEDPSLSEQLRKQPIADLMTAIGLNERYLYANELFEGDMEAFREVIKILNEFDDREQAVAYFKSQLIPTYEWKADHDLVKALYLLVERRYQN